MISFKVRIFGIMFKESFPTPRSYRKSYFFFILIFISLGKNNFFREWVPDKLFNFIACLKRLIFHPCLWMLDQMQSFWVPLELQPVSIELCKYCSKFYYRVAKRKLEGISFSSETSFLWRVLIYIYIYLCICIVVVVLIYWCIVGLQCVSSCCVQQSDSVIHILYAHSFLHSLPLWSITGYWL